MKLKSFVRNTSWTLVAAVGVLVLAGLAAPSRFARASLLDLRHDDYDTPPPVVATSCIRVVPASGYYESRRPIRRRPPHNDYYSPHQPRTFVTLGVGSFEPSDQPGNGLFMSGTFGTEISQTLDLGGAFNWYHRSNGGSEYITNFTDPAGNTGTRVVVTDNIQTDLVPLLGFVRVKFPVSPAVQPYVGAGVGWEWLMVDGVDVNGNSFHDNYDGFGAQLFGGANFNVSPNTAIYAEALFNSSTVSADYYDPTTGITVRDEIKMDGAAAHAGLRLRF